ncbi:MAG: succinate dehydrogenase/fumarate reductase iron-sulfur subunit [Myxococcota bacterium]
MRIKLEIWRQDAAETPGRFETYRLDGLSPDMSFLDMLDALNADLAAAGHRTVVFDHDCREGICGQCGVVINGRPHGPTRGRTTCQLHLRAFHDGDTIVVEPWRARAFPVVCDLVVDRTAFDRIVAAGGYVSVNTGSAPDAGAIPIPREDAERAFDAAACIGCGACVAACDNASAVLFTGAKVSHLAAVPQGRVERTRRVLDMVAAMDGEGFGACGMIEDCSAVCPKDIGIENIAQLNAEYLRAKLS